MADLDAIIKHFGDAAGTYDSQSLSFPWSWIRQVEWCALSGLASHVVGLPVLDLGCGAGLYSRRFRDLGASRVHATDVSSQMISSLEGEENISTTISSVEKLDIGEKFDLIVAAGLVEFLDAPEDLFGTAKRHANAGATLLVLFPCNGLLSKLYKFYHRLNGLQINIIPERELRSIAKSQDWDLVSTKCAGPISMAASFRIAGHGPAPETSEHND
jgi:SAM-dependent methyltransferase